MYPQFQDLKASRPNGTVHKGAVSAGAALDPASGKYRAQDARPRSRIKCFINYRDTNELASLLLRARTPRRGIPCHPSARMPWSHIMNWEEFP